MTHLELRNKFGQIDLASIDPAAVAELSDAAQEKLAVLIDAVTAHNSAKERHAKAIAAVHEAEAEQLAAMQDNRTASDPFPFTPPDPANFHTQDKYDAAVAEAFERHQQSVREHRAAIERRRAIAAYVPAN